MKRYNKMISTGIPWTPNVPESWKVIPAKRIFDNPKQKNDGNKEKNILSLTLGGVIRNNIDNPIGLSPADYATYQIFEPNDLVFKLIDLENISTSRVGLVNERGAMSSAYIRFSAHSLNDVNIRYFYLQYYSMWLRNIFNGLGAGVRQTLSASDLLDIKIVVPPRYEQDQIVRYLDWQTSRINKLIKGYKRQIELLEERKQTIIDQYSTQGIAKTVKFKKSGTHWLSEIPEHWNMVYSKQLFAQRKDKAFSDDIQLTASQKYGILSQDEFMKLEGRRVTVVMTGNDILKHVGKGDFVISMRSFQGGLEYSRTEGKISSAYVMLIPNREKVCDDYFRWLLKSTPYIKALQGTADLVRDGQALRYANFAKISLPEIPLNEQKEIAERIQTETEKIDNAIPIFEKQIALLQEYRTRLISDVVTGQVDVRDIQIPEYIPEEETEMTDMEVEKDAD